MKKIKQFKKAVSVGLLFCVLASFSVFFLPKQVLADSAATYSVDINVSLNQDGSAQVTEVWDVNIVDGTEYYLTKYDLLDGQDIRDFTVSDETGRVYTPIGEWDSSVAGVEKYGKSGMIATKGGYELCWGVYNDYGKHTYTVQYTMDGLIQNYQTADAINQTFVANGLYNPPQKVSITIEKPDYNFTSDDTRVWAFGTTGDIHVENGKVVLTTQGSVKSSEWVSVFVAFNQGIFSPTVTNSRSFETALEQAMQGSNYSANEQGDYNGTTVGTRPPIFLFIFVWVVIIGTILVATVIIKRATKNGKGRKIKPPKKYREVPYSRDLPWNGNIVSTYTRLDDLNQLPEVGSIIGAYLLRWIRTRQIDIVQAPAGMFGKKEEMALQLYQQRAEMTLLEANLYRILLMAAGSDFILESKEFERWSQANYTYIKGWLEQVKNEGKFYMRSLGACDDDLQAGIFGFGTTYKTVYNSVGEEYTARMYGFKKYLEDYTIINEREAREVQLWDEYLVYAQIFGIADTVAEQFKEIYPKYFVDMSAQMGVNLDFYDIMIISHMARNFSYAAGRGYTSGEMSANMSSFSGGGGGFSGGGGGGGGGFGGGGGGGGTR